MTEYEQQYAQLADTVSVHLATYLSGDAGGYRSVVDAMRYSLLGGGKRVRGVLVLGCCKLFREDYPRALPFASAVEMIHAYSLIHDDLPCMDDDDMRRGKPACHIAYGEATALLAGDALQTLAFEAMSAAVSTLPADAVVRAIALLAQGAGTHGMVAGQVLDLAGEGRDLSADELDAVNDRKTGALIRAAARMGCVLGGAKRAQEEAVDAYAARLGRAFQIVDDILDETADPSALGKPVGSDRQNRKTTYAALYGVERCRQEVRRLTEEAKEALRETGLDTVFLCEMADHMAGRAY